MASSHHLIALRDLLAAETGQAVVIGRPTEEERGLSLWPWKLELQAQTRNLPPERPGGPPAAKPPVLPPLVRLLLLAMGQSEVEQVEALEAASRVIQLQPLFGPADRRGRVWIETIPTSELTAIFTAAGLPLRLCLSCRLESVA